jgi:predicted nicotinamide N-methyase
VLDAASRRGEVAVLATKAGAVVSATDIGPRLVQVIQRRLARKPWSLACQVNGRE